MPADGEKLQNKGITTMLGSSRLETGIKNIIFPLPESKYSKVQSQNVS
jgi:hypothetical protein